MKKKLRPEAVVEITTRGGPFPDTSPAVLRRRAEKMLRHLGMAGVELSIALVASRTSQADGPLTTVSDAPPR